MFLDSWEDFAQRARQMYMAAPMRTRYVMRYNHQKGRLVVKVTDDSKCWQFRTDQQADIKKINELNQFFMEFMSGARIEGEEDVEMAPVPAPALPASKKGKRRG